jgi:hypothetical protein
MRTGTTEPTETAHAYRDAVKVIFATVTAELRVAVNRAFNDAFDELDALIDRSDDTRILEKLNERRDELARASARQEVVIDRLDPDKALSWR